MVSDNDAILILSWQNDILTIMSLRSIGVDCRVDGFEDLRKKYPFYRECGYPYSAMQICTQNDKRN